MTNELTADGLRELVAGATPEYWTFSDLDQGTQLYAGIDQYVGEIRDYYGNDSALIVALVNAAPQIIALIEREARMREALTVRDAKALTCPINSPRCSKADRAKCSKCGALPSESCIIKALADDTFVGIARAALQPEAKETDDGSE